MTPAFATYLRLAHLHGRQIEFVDNEVIMSLLYELSKPSEGDYLQLRDMLSFKPNRDTSYKESLRQQ